MSRDPRRWERVKGVFQSALERAPEERARFLDDTCGDDAVLRDEVDSLLAAHQDAGSFAQTPYGTAAASSLTPGLTLGPYRIVHKIGAGGMGEVYRARDARLGRDVALKVLPRALSDDADRVARLDREARVLAALNHPHIATIHGLEEGPAEGGRHVRALVLELVEGPTLAERLASGPMRLDEALRIAAQIADALAAAHDKGIIHRDLKPANIKLTPSGAVKVLDFGLAKPLAIAAVTIAPASGVSMPMTTVEGVLVGTPAYMSPEQARGEALDKRADVWAFGCVLFEMLSGRRAFEEATTTETLGRVLERDPDWGALSADTQRGVRTLLRRCLQKDSSRRLRDLVDVRLEIEEALAAPLPAEPVDHTADVARHRRRLPVALVAAISGVVGLAGGAIFSRGPFDAPSAIRATLDVLPADEVGTNSVLDMLPGGTRTALAWSPNGKTLAFVGLAAGVRRVYLRDLDSEMARPVDGTEGVRSLTFSPDGEWIAFWAGRAIQKVRAAGGPPAKICDAAVGTDSGISGISWGSTRIVFTAGSGLFAVSPTGGGEPLLLHRSNLRLSSPFLLPDDAAVLYTEYGKGWTSGDEHVMVQSLATGAAPRVLLREAADAKYLATGHLAFLRQGTLVVVPFRAESLAVHGDQTAVLKGVAQAVSAWASNDLTLAGQVAVSPQGTLAYLGGATPSLPDSEVVVINRHGDVTPLGPPAATYRSRVELSPDGASVAVPLQTARSVRLFLYDLLRKTPIAAVPDSRDQEVFAPVWSADGKIAMAVSQGGGTALAVFRPDSTAPPLTVSDSSGFIPSSWSPDGERLVGLKSGDLWIYSATGRDPTWTRLTDTPSNESYPVWSPTGRWLAYTSTINDRPEVFLMADSGAATPISVSTNGGVMPAWNPNGAELFYVEGRTNPQAQNDLGMMSVDMSSPLRPGLPKRLFYFSPSSLLLATCSPTGCFSVAPNGNQFFALRMLPRQPVRVTQIRLVFNWLDELKRLAPTN